MCARPTPIHFDRLGVPSQSLPTICAPVYPLTISVVMKSIPLCGTSSMTLVNQGREASGELWQECFFDRALRTVKE